MNGDQFDIKPLYTAPVVGLRAFDWTLHGDRAVALESVSAAYEWTPGENVAACFPQSPIAYTDAHTIAMKGCTCGFYAYFDEANDYAEGDRLVGIIEGYGSVCAGTRGFRASKARVVALVRPSETLAGMSQVLASYKVPIYDTVEEALAEHPTTKVEDLGIEPETEEEAFRRLWGQWIPMGTIPQGGMTISSNGSVTINMPSGTYVSGTSFVPQTSCQCPLCKNHKGLLSRMWDTLTGSGEGEEQEEEGL